MNREIKFRAWDKKNKRMMENVSTGTIHIFDYARTGKERTSKEEDCEFMQYTGLKDKNGKEIYDGDIVRCSLGCHHQIVWTEELGGEFGGGMPGWYLKGLLSWCGKGYAWTGTEEVIGNIYENPELIK